MDTTDFDRPIATVPSDDGSIDRAIDELDTKITDWVSAMSAAHRAVIQRAAAANEQMMADVAAEAAALATPPTETVPVARPIAATAADAADAAGGDKPPVGVTETPAPAAAPSESGGLRLDHLRTGAARPRAGIRAFEGAEVEVEKPDTARHDDDEALLATLDPKLAKQIKIKRRLCNGTKSIRELLAEGTG